MTARIPDTHGEAWALLPWLANGRISNEDREWVDAHLQGCEECRAELAAQRLVASHVTRNETASPAHSHSNQVSSNPGSEEQRSFNKLWARIEASESAAAAASGAVGVTTTAPRNLRTVRWLAAAVVVQAIGLGLLGLALTSQRDTAEPYKTVAVPEARLDAPAVSLVFAPEASITTINTLLTHQGLSVVAGPGREGNYMAELSADAVASGATAESVAAVMSKDPNVAFAQPIAH
jgi:anti-sigma factor RsiW